MERVPVVAGRFYPEDPEELEAAVDRCLGGETESRPAFAAIVPHAALSASGDVAGAVYSRIDIPSVVVLLCSSHVGDETRGAIMTHGTFKFPSGAVPIDTRVAEELRSLAMLTEDEEPHRNEHAIEVQLPFLVRRNPRVRIVPVVFGPLPPATCLRIGRALADILSAHSREVLAVATSNLGHYLPADALEANDAKSIDAMRRLDLEGLFAAAEGPSAMDGAVPVGIALAAAKALGADESELVARGDSSAGSSDGARAVGYAGLVVR